MKPIALILAGGSISHRMSSELSHIKCPALMPLHLSTIGGLNVQFFSQQGDTVYLAVDAPHVAEVRENIGVDPGKYTLISVDGGAGVVDTLESALTQIRAKHPDNPPLKVNLVTTIPTRDISLHEVFVSNISGRLVQQCSWLEDQSGTWIAHSKNQPTDRDKVDAFTGSFCAHLEELIAATTPLSDRTDLLGVVGNLLAHLGDRVLVKHTDWIDCGHEISYLKARSRFLSSRSFNRLTIDLENGIIRKRSDKLEKMDDEAGYFEKLPDELKIYFPRLTQRLTGPDGHTCGYDLEYYAYPTLAEYALYWRISGDAWWLAFEQLNHIVRHFRRFKTSFGPSSFHEAIVGKTQERLHHYFDSLTTGERSLLRDSELVINGETCRSFSHLEQRLYDRLSSLYDDSCFTVVHGDLCFNNILYSPASGLIKLIDPRGSFGPHKGIHGDFRYDLAKLMHSVSGGYDSIVNGHYQLSLHGHAVGLDIPVKGSFAHARDAFHWMLRQQGADPVACGLLTASLFLSMLPLHEDCPQRQRALYITGLSMLNKLEP